MKLDYETYEEVSEALYKMRDKLEKQPELEDLEFIDFLSEEIKEQIKGMVDAISEAYSCLDICGFDIIEIKEREET